MSYCVYKHTCPNNNGFGYKAHHSHFWNAILKYGISQAHVCSVCKGKRKTAGGFHWAYFDEVMKT